MAERVNVERPSPALRRVLVPLALAQFICSFAGSNMNVMITDISTDLDTTIQGVQTVITLFLLPDLNLRLRPIILDLKPGTRIVSNSFTMGEWQPDEEASVTQDCVSWCRALFWVVPAKVGGAWRLGSETLTLNQTFQMLSGTSGGGTVTDGRLRGDEITFSIGNTKYTGRVNGATMQGTMSGGRTGAWTATRP